MKIEDLTAQQKEGVSHARRSKNGSRRASQLSRAGFGKNLACLDGLVGGVRG